jgi:hypothetical protein
MVWSRFCLWCEIGNDRLWMSLVWKCSCGSVATSPIINSSQAGFSVLSYSAIIEEIASHGYVIIGINHTYDASVTVFADGRVTPASPEFMEHVNSRAGSIEESFQFRSAVADYRAEDIKFIVDQLEQINEESSVLRGRLNTIGHVRSFSGRKCCIGILQKRWSL